MEKPTPKAELALKLIGDNQIWIWTYNSDAYTWVETNCQAFGNLHKPGVMNHWDLFVSPGYEVAEVFAYVRSYLNQKAPADS